MSPLRSPSRGGALPAGRLLRILFYVDAEVFLHKFRTDLLQEALVGGVMNIEIEVELRNREAPLTDELLARYDEIWFFLWRERGPGELPLADAETAALLVWMDRGGGVLITGDHAAEYREGHAIRYEGLGAHVGRRIPRARHMRAWDEPPGPEVDQADTVDSFDGGLPLQLEKDAVPQRLLLPVNDRAEPHVIFRDSQGRTLDRFPDHRHEGRVKVTITPGAQMDPLIVGEWPPNSPAPEIIARGVNWRLGRTEDLMAQWDGHRVQSTEPSVHGRIIADSSFHHYAYDNLAEIAASGGRNWEKITEIYRNLAAWLAPPDVRSAYGLRALDWVIQHPYVVAVAGAELTVVGEVARRLLAEVLPGAWLHELVDDLLKQLAGKRPPLAPRLSFDVFLLGAHVRQLAAVANPALPVEGIEQIVVRGGPVRGTAGVRELQARVLGEAHRSYDIVSARNKQQEDERKRLDLKFPPGEE